MEIQPVRKTVVRKGFGEFGGAAGYRAEGPVEELREMLRFYEVLFEELGCELNVMADVLMAMDLRMDLLEEEVDGMRKGAAPRLGNAPPV